MSPFWEQILGTWREGGLLLFLLALVCMGIWGHFLRSRQRILCLIRESRSLEKEMQGGEIPELHPERFGIHVLLQRVLADLQSGAGARSSFYDREHECMQAARKDLMILAALTAVAPLLGLLGTVLGMIDTFDAVSAMSGDTAVKVAGGISQALVTTQFGLVVALPGVFGISRLKRLLIELQAHLGSLRAQWLASLDLMQAEGLAS